jgi:Family of unknown function (DUF5690)
MYGYRKAISATTFEGQQALGISFKSALIIAQVLGYMISKLVGIKFISELKQSKRQQYILRLILSAHASLLFLALVPSPVNILFLFTNGLCLGLIWGLVFSYIEGRRFTDFLALVLSINFIFSSGTVKSIGLGIMKDWQVAEIYMPFVTGLLFLPLLFISVWMLGKIPPPSAEEVKNRGVRTSLDQSQRVKLFKQFLTGLVAVALINLFFTILRDVKDNYGVEIIRSLLPNFESDIFSKMETIAAFSVFFLLLLVAGIKNHFKSIRAHHLVMTLSFAGVLLCSFFLNRSILSPIAVLILYTICLYLGYNTLQCLFLERFIASFKINGNIGFLFYIMDTVAYSGSCVIIIHKELFSPKLDWLAYFLQISLVIGIIGLALTLVSWIYFTRKHKTISSGL